MGFSDITRGALDALNQSYRVPGLIPGPVDPVLLDASGAGGSVYWKVNDEFIRILPFVSVDDALRPYGKQYVAISSNVASEEPLSEPPFGANASAGSSWAPGTTTAFGEDLEGSSQAKRFKKVSVFVRTDELMNDDADSIGGGTCSMLRSDWRRSPSSAA